MCIGDVRRVSRVLFTHCCADDHLSPPRIPGRAASSPSRLLSTFGLGEPPSATGIGCVRPDRRLQQGGLPVSSGPPKRPARFCCSQAVAHPPACAGLSARCRASPAFAGHPALCCSDFPLRLSPQRPSCPTPRIALSMRRTCHACTASGGLRKLVPKEGFEPSRPYGHYALNVARLPIPPLRPTGADDRI